MAPFSPDPLPDQEVHLPATIHLAACTLAEELRDEAYKALDWTAITPEASERCHRAERMLLNARGAAYAGGTYVADGGAADRTSWCSCPSSDDDIYYEAYSTAGLRTAHGYVCKTCRQITQTG